MNDERCLYVALSCPPDRHDTLLRELIAPLARGLRKDASLDSLFFVRYAEPEWQLRFRVLGRAAWVDGPVRENVDAALRPFLADGTFTNVVFGEYIREWDRYGGPEGMRLAEKLFFHDSIACLDLLDAEARGDLARTRREWSLVYTEELLDLLAFDAARRREFYREGHAWAWREGVFREEDRPRLEGRFRAVAEGIRGLLEAREAGDLASAFGGPSPARIAAGALAAARPVVEALLAARAAGRITQDLVPLAWSYAHLHANRLGIEVVPEAILRYLMFRHYEERLG